MTAPPVNPASAHPDGPRHVLSFDVEEYFQAEAASVPPRRWSEFPSRLQPAVERILQVLADHSVRATFFTLGGFAKAVPGLIRMVASAGHEIASHGMSHRMLTRLSPAELRQELTDSRKSLEDVAGQRVEGYRAPTFSITHATAWGLDVLAECGYRYDSSVFPVHHDRYGVPDAPRWPHLAIGPGGGQIIEWPPLTLRALRVNWPVGGGGYLRLLPVRILARALTIAQQHGAGGMIYLHPWEFDPAQPVLPMSRLSRFRHRVNLHRTEAKLTWLLQRFRFTSAAACLNGLAKADLPTFRYG